MFPVFVGLPHIYKLNCVWGGGQGRNPASLSLGVNIHLQRELSISFPARNQIIRLTRLTEKKSVNLPIYITTDAVWFESHSRYPRILLSLYICCCNLHPCSLIIIINTMTANTSKAHSDGLIPLSREACRRSAGQQVFPFFSLSRKFVAMSTTAHSRTVSF